ncbi:hypothetical protein Micbo1qcDRAFT_169971, partial [Microdochium bolleyi]
MIVTGAQIAGQVVDTRFQNACPPCQVLTLRAAQHVCLTSEGERLAVAISLETLRCSPWSSRMKTGTLPRNQQCRYCD